MAKRGPKCRITDEHKDAVIWHIESGLTLAETCKKPDTPTRDAVNGLRKRDKEFAARYDAAVKIRAGRLAEQALETAQTIADKEVKSSQEINAARLLIDTIKWTAAVTDPHRYAPQTKVEHNGKIEHEDKGDTRELAKAILQVLSSAVVPGDNAKVINGDAREVVE